MDTQDKIKRAVAATAAIGALGLGGAALAGAANGGSGSAANQQSEGAEAPGAEATEGPENQAAEGPEQGEGAASEQEATLSGPDADRAKAAAETATGGKALDVSADNAGSENGGGADDGAGGQQGFQSPANAAYEVAVDKGGKEIDVYLDKDFQVITTQAGEQD